MSHSRPEILGLTLAVAGARQSGTLTVRVPAENVGTQDVSKAYSDLETRLRVKRDTAHRLREILRTRTARLPDILEAGLFSPVADALRDSVRVLVASLSGLVYLLVFLAPWSVIAVLFWRASRGLRSRRKAKAATVA